MHKLKDNTRNVHKHMSNWIILNSGSTLSLFMNHELLENIIRALKNTLEMATNMGIKWNVQEADVLGFGSV